MQWAEVYIYIRQKLLVLEVNDDGAGFDVKEADGGNGLGNMQKRADALQGKVEIISSIGNGTRVKLSVPQK